MIATAMTASPRSDLDSLLDALVSRLDRLEARIVRLEHAADLDAGKREDAAPSAAESRSADVPIDIARVGRLVLILGGAYLLRALTESAAFPSLAGMTIGLMYAGVWMWLGHRAARRGNIPGALFDLVAASMIAWPIIWEGVSRFHALPANVVAGVLLVVGGVKIVAEDLRVGSPLTIALALALYGGAMLIVAWGRVREST